MADNPYVLGSTIGRARADLLDQYDRGEVKDPRARLELIDKLLNELLSTWGTHPMAQEHIEGVRCGIDHGLEDRQTMHSHIKSVDENKKKKSMKEMYDGKKQSMKDAIDEKKFSEKMQPPEDEENTKQQGNSPAWLGKKRPSKA